MSRVTFLSYTRVADGAQFYHCAGDFDRVRVFG